MTAQSTFSAVVIDCETLRRRCINLLVRAGVPEEDAETTADVFWQAEMMGEESHGIRLLLHVLGRLRAGGDRAKTEIVTIIDRDSLAVWDGQRSLGQVTAARAMKRAIEKARKHGIGFVTVRNSNSFTSAKYYPMMAAKAGMIGCAFTNTSRKLMPAPGGMTPVIGNNPVAYAAPAGRYGAFVLDMACTAAAVERISVAREQRRLIPKGWALDAEGNETTDPEKALQTLTLLPFGGYKAFGLAMVHEMLTSILAGGALFAGEAKGFMPYDAPMNTSFSLMAIDISALQDLAAFEAAMECMIDTIKSSRRRDPTTAILYPGERAFAEFARRKRDGVPVAAATLAALDELAGGYGMPAISPTQRQREDS